MTHPLDGLAGGSDYNRSKYDGNGQGRKQQAEKIQIPIFKYTARFRQPLHEAILLGGNEPFFLTWNQQNQVIESIHQIEEKKRILRPPDEAEYPYEPIEFDSLKEIREYTVLAKHETIDSLYQKVKSTVILYVDQENDIIILISADIIWTWFQDIFPTTHYYDVNGKANGIGKSTIGHVFEGIAYRAVRMTDPSAANFFRVLGPIEPGQCTIIADEADRIHKDRDALSVLKEGYNKFGRVPKINTNTLKQEFFYAYGFKIRIAEDPLRGEITKGVIDRSFQIKAIRGNPMHDIKEVLDPASRIERLQKLRNDLRHLRKLLLCYRLIHYNDEIADIDIGREGRDKELTKPLLQLFYGSKAYDEVKSTVFTFLDRKNKRKKSTAIEPALFEIVVDMIESRKSRRLLFSDIWDTIRTTVPGVYVDSRPNEYQTYDYDTIYRTITSKIIEGFGAEHEREHRGRVLVFNPRIMLKTCKQYEASKEIQDKLKNIQSVSVDWDKKATDTPSRGQDDGKITDYPDGNKDTPRESPKSDEKEGRDGMTAGVQDPPTVMPQTTVAVNTEDNNYDIYGGRKSRNHEDDDGWLGNPYNVGKDGTKEECVEKYDVYFHNRIETDVEFHRRVLGAYGKRLGCPGNCKPGACHLDTVVDYLNNLTYSDLLIKDKPIWDIEERGIFPHEAELFKEEVERLGKEREKNERSKVADTVKANISDN